MDESEFTLEQVEDVKARIIRDRDVLKNLGANVVMVSKVLDANRVLVVVTDLRSAESVIRGRYGEIVVLEEGTVSPT